MAMTLRLDDADEQILTQLARAQGVSKQEAIRLAIRENAERRAHTAQVAELSTAARARWAEVLDRLGQ